MGLNRYIATPNLYKGDRREWLQLGGPVPEQKPIDRDPCLRCGARGDLNCGHSRGPLVSTLFSVGGDR